MEKGYGDAVTLPGLFTGLDETPLVRSPIVSVIWQLRFDDHPTIASPQAALRLQELLGGEDEFSLAPLPRVQVSVQQVGPGPAPALAASPAAGWRLAATDGSCQVSLEASSVSIETAQYGSWADHFLPRLKRLVEAIETVGPPVLEARLGLRYVNVLVGSAVDSPPFSSPNDLQRVIAPWLLGPLVHESLRDWVQIAQGRISFKFDGLQAICNHGVVSAENGELGYLIDVDAFREGGRAFHAGEVVEQSRNLHLVALGLFQSSLTVETLDAMRSSQR